MPASAAGSVRTEGQPPRSSPPPPPAPTVPPSSRSNATAGRPCACAAAAADRWPSRSAQWPQPPRGMRAAPARRQRWRSSRSFAGHAAAGKGTRRTSRSHHVRCSKPPSRGRSGQSPDPAARRSHLGQSQAARTEQHRSWQLAHHRLISHPGQGGVPARPAVKHSRLRVGCAGDSRRCREHSSHRRHG